jgi:transposase
MMPGERYDARLREIWAGIDPELSTRQAWALAREPMIAAKEECELALADDTAGSAHYAFWVPDEDLSPEERAALHDLMSRSIKRGQARTRDEGTRSGRPIGKPAKISAERDDAAIRQLRDEGVSVEEIAKRYGAAIRTVYDSLKRTASSS